MSDPLTEFLDTLPQLAKDNSILPSVRRELRAFLSMGQAIGFQDPFVRKVVLPIYTAQKELKAQRFKTAKYWAGECAAPRLRERAVVWIEEKWKEAQLSIKS